MSSLFGAKASVIQYNRHGRFRCVYTVIRGVQLYTAAPVIIAEVLLVQCKSVEVKIAHPNER